MSVPIPSPGARDREAPLWGIVLAAGSSRRMGRDKATLPWGSGTLLEAHVAALRQAGLSPVVVVASDHGPIADAAGTARRVLTHGRTNTPWQSLLAALTQLPTPLGVLVTPVDVPPPDPSVLAAMHPDEDLVPVGPDGRDGHPVRLASGSCARVRREAEPAEGLRTLLRTARRVPVPVATGQDFDTPRAWKEARHPPSPATRGLEAGTRREGGNG